MEEGKRNIAKIKESAEPREDKILRYGEGDRAVEVKVKTTLPFTRRLEMIGDIVGMVFAGKGDTIECYVPAFTEFARRYAVIAYYTDAELPSDLDKVWELLNDTPLYRDVAGIVRHDLKTIFKEAEEAIRARRDYLISKTDIMSLFHKLFDTLKPLEGIDAKDVMDTLKKLPQMSLEDTVEAILKTKPEDPPQQDKGEN